jgi:hypothetical protein
MHDSLITLKNEKTNAVNKEVLLMNTFEDLN